MWESTKRSQGVPRIHSAPVGKHFAVADRSLFVPTSSHLLAKSSALLVLNRVRRSLTIQGKNLQLPTDRQTGRKIANSFVAGLVLELSCHRNFLSISQYSKKFARAVDCDLVNDPKFAFEYRNVLMNGLEVQNF